MRNLRICGRGGFEVFFFPRPRVSPRHFSLFLSRLSLSFASLDLASFSFLLRQDAAPPAEATAAAAPAPAGRRCKEESAAERHQTEEEGEGDAGSKAEASSFDLDLDLSLFFFDLSPQNPPFPCATRDAPPGSPQALGPRPGLLAAAAGVRRPLPIHRNDDFFFFTFCCCCCLCCCYCSFRLFFFLCCFLRPSSAPGHRGSHGGRPGPPLRLCPAPSRVPNGLGITRGTPLRRRHGREQGAGESDGEGAFARGGFRRRRLQGLAGAGEKC